jgi:small GTP-binding protein
LVHVNVQPAQPRQLVIAMRPLPPGALPCRVVTVGDASVGKTSMVSQLIEHTFRLDESATIGANFREFSRRVQGTRIELQIWDTAGQEKFRSLTPIYFRNAQAAVAVFAMDNEQSFDSLKAQISNFLAIAPDAIVYIAGNKTDIRREAVKRDEAVAFAQAQGYRIYFTSAKTGDAIERMFTDLCGELFEKKERLVGKSQMPLPGASQWAKPGCCS